MIAAASAASARQPMTMAAAHGTNPANCAHPPITLSCANHPAWPGSCALSDISFRV
jgi:hypothetical protein